MSIAMLIIGCYLVGSIPFGVIVGRAWRGVDVREYGSRNIGFSNVLRVLGWGPASVVALGDVLKGAGPVLAGRGMLELWGMPQSDLWVLAVAVAPILGHSFSVFLGFRGGRAVATTFGVLLGMSWPAALVALGVWLLLVGTTRYISVSSMGASVAIPAYLVIAGGRWEWTVFRSAVGLLIVRRHIPNIGRLLRGTEAKIGQRVRVEDERGESAQE